MCRGQQGSLSIESINPSRTRRRQANDKAMEVEDLRGRLAETEARLARSRAREAELNRRLEEMKRFVCVMEILEFFLRRQFGEQQERLFAVPRV